MVQIFFTPTATWIRTAHLRVGRLLLVTAEPASVLGLATLLWMVDRPGVFAFDSMLQWYEGHVGQFDSNQPPALGFLWNQLAGLGEAASLLVGLSCLSFCVGVYLIARYYCRPRISLAILAAVALFPPVFAQIATINKESISSHLLVLGFGLVLQARRQGGSQRLCMLAAATAAVAVMVRYQYVVVAAALYIVCLPPLRDARQRGGVLRDLLRPAVAWIGAFVACVAMLAIWIDASAAVDWQASFTKNFRLLREYELSALVARATAPDLSELAAAGIDPSQAIEAMRRGYTPESNVPLFKVVTLLAPVPTEMIAHQTATLARQQPGNGLLTHRLATFSRLLGLHGVCWPVQKQIIRPPLGTPERQWADTVGASNLPDSIASKIFRSRLFPVNNILFKPILYLFIAGALLLWFISTASCRTTWRLLAGLPFSGLVYAVTFVMITPSCDFRYLYWTVLSATLSVAIVLAVGLGNIRREAGVAR